jgi:hypothetical protein
MFLFPLGGNCLRWHASNPWLEPLQPNNPLTAFTSVNLRFFFTIFLLLCAALRAQTNEVRPVLHGSIDGNTYVSPTGAFRMPIPVLPELGGVVYDTDNVVTFADEFKTHVSVAVFLQDATQRWENETRGRRDYLIFFFSNYVMPDFSQRAPGAKIEGARFLPGVQDGALIVYTLLPGGSMFTNRISLTGETDPALVAKRGNLLFVKDEHVFVISLELAERVLEHNTYHKTTAEEDELLRTRLLGLLGQIEFSSPRAAPGKK